MPKPFTRLSSAEQEQELKNKIIDNTKQGKDFVQITTHPTTATNKGMKYKEIWISQNGGTTRLNVRAENGTVYFVLLTGT